MIISYSHERFPALIKAGIKIHTIRKRGRWKAGMKMHHWMYSPRNPSKNPYFFLENVCTGTQPIFISAFFKEVFIETDKAIGKLSEVGRELDWREIAINDGFNENPDLLWKWFTESSHDMEIVHWTQKRY